MKRHHALALAALAFSGCAGPPALPPPPPGDPLAVNPIGPVFDDARAIAVDPAGTLYIADAGAATITVLDANGVPWRTLGGPGVGGYAFLEPSDVDAGNGLVLTIADAGNGRIQRFSRDGRLLNSIPVATSPGRHATEGGRATEGGDARPVAVATAVTGEMYVVEEAAGAVLRWDAQGRFDRALGGMSEGEGALRTPIGLALDPDGRLYVADRGHRAVLVYDAFGQYLRRIADGRLSGVVAVAALGDRLAIALPQRVLLYGFDGRFRGALAPTAGSGLVDVAGYAGRLFVLTQDRLYRSDTTLR